MTRENILAYLAGLVDGEGCLSFSMNGQLRLSVRMKAFEGVKAFTEVFGVPVREKETQDGIYYNVDLTGQKAVEVIRELLPFLRVKLDQANLSVSYWNQHVDCSRRPVPDNVLEHRVAVYLEMKRLNRRGKADEYREQTGEATNVQ